MQDRLDQYKERQQDAIKMNRVLANEKVEVIRQTRAEFRSNKQFFDHGGTIRTPKAKGSGNNVFIAGGGGAIFKTVEPQTKKGKVKRQATLGPKV